MLKSQPVMLNLIQHPKVQRCTWRFRIKSGMTANLLTYNSPFSLFTIYLILNNNPLFIQLRMYMAECFLHSNLSIADKILVVVFQSAMVFHPYTIVLKRIANSTRRETIFT